MIKGDLRMERVVGASNFSESTSRHHMDVPSGKRWWLFGGNTNRSASATVDIYVRDASANLKFILQDDAAATGVTCFPNPTADELRPISMPIPLEETDYIDFLFGAAQGAAAYVAVIIIEVDA